MKQFPRILAIAILVVLSVVANAQVKAFDYKSGDSVSTDFSGAGDLAMLARTRIKVSPYLYISGNLGAEWTVDGWGTGIDKRLESVRFFHNETLTLDLEGFQNPQKTGGSKRGAQEVRLEGQLKCFNDQSGQLIFDSGMKMIAKLNDVFNPSGPSFEVEATGGVMRLDFARSIRVSPLVGPGTYENVGVIKVIRN